MLKCWCDSSFSHVIRVQEKDCKKDCRIGEGKCGGSNRNSLYRAFNPNLGCDASGNILKYMEDAFASKLKVLEDHLAKLQAGIEPEPRTRFILKVSQGKVQQSFDRIGEERQINPSEGFHGTVHRSTSMSQSFAYCDKSLIIFWFFFRALLCFVDSIF